MTKQQTAQFLINETVSFLADFYGCTQQAVADSMIAKNEKVCGDFARLIAKGIAAVA